MGTQPPFLLPIQEQKHIDEENAHLINSRMEKMRMVGVVRDFISSLVSIDRLYTHTRRAAGDIKEEREPSYNQKRRMLRMHTGGNKKKKMKKKKG